MRTIVPALTIFSVGSFLQAQSNVPLLENWPFTPPGSAQSAQSAAEEGPASLARLQLRGITSIDGEYIFSVYNPDTRESKWLPQGQAQDGLTIRSYDAERNTVVIHSETENLSRQMQMNDYAAPSGIRPAPQPAPVRTSAQSSPTGTATRTTPTPTGTLTRTQQSVQRPTRRNLETLRARRAELAEKLRKQPSSGQTNQGQGDNQSSNGGNR